MKRYHHSKHSSKRKHHEMHHGHEHHPMGHHHPMHHEHHSHSMHGEHMKKYGPHHSPEREPMPHYSRTPYSGGYYEGPEMRLRMEHLDGEMIHEDHNAVANLPQQPIMKYYPVSSKYMPEGIDDSIRGIDFQIDLDDSRRDKTMVPKKV